MMRLAEIKLVKEGDVEGAREVLKGVGKKKRKEFMRKHRLR